MSNCKFILPFYWSKLCSEFVTVSLFDHFPLVTPGMFGGALSFEDELSKRMVRQKEQIYASGATVLRYGNWDYITVKRVCEVTFCMHGSCRGSNLT